MADYWQEQEYGRLQNSGRKEKDLAVKVLKAAKLKDLSICFPCCGTTVV